MSHLSVLDGHVLEALPKDLDDLVILDVACGLGLWGFLIRIHKSGCPYLIGIDVWRPHLAKISPLNVYDEVIQTQLPNISLKEKSVDISLACEVIEHLPTSVGYELLNRIEEITRQTIIVTTPLNFPQDEMYGNPYEKHISEWPVAVFAKLGYETRIIHTLPKTLRFADAIRTFALRLPLTPRLILTRKRLKS
jgi:SAM-dependent methyltransferase